MIEIIKNAEAKKKFDALGIKAVGVKSIKTGLGTHVKAESFEDFMRFTEELGANTVYLAYTYYDSNYYFVDVDVAYYPTFDIDETYYDTYPKELKEELIARDKELYGLDFNRPHKLWIAASKGRALYITKFEHEWLDEDKYVGVDDYIKSIPGYELWNYEYYPDIEQIESNLGNYTQDEINTMIEELETTILSDPDFKYCTNQQKRGDYLWEVVFNTAGDNSKYKKLFNLSLYKECNGPLDIDDFMTMLWVKYNK